MREVFLSRVAGASLQLRLNVHFGRALGQFPSRVVFVETHGLAGAMEDEHAPLPESIKH